jgi:hypothetical protein
LIAAAGTVSLLGGTVWLRMQAVTAANSKAQQLEQLINPDAIELHKSEARIDSD